MFQYTGRITLYWIVIAFQTSQLSMNQFLMTCANYILMRGVCQYDTLCTTRLMLAARMSSSHTSLRHSHFPLLITPLLCFYRRYLELREANTGTIVCHSRGNGWRDLCVDPNCITHYRHVSYSGLSSCHRNVHRSQFLAFSNGPTTT